MKKLGFGTLGLALVAAAALAAQAQAGVIITPTAQDGSFDPLPQGSLIAGQLPAAGSTLNTSDQEGLGSDPTGAALTNGQFGQAGLTEGGPNTDMTIISNGTNLFYNLAKPSTITEIDTYSAWRDPGRVNQDYTVLYSTNNGQSYQQLAQVDVVGGQTSPTDLKVALTDSTGTLATGVTNLEFYFPTTQNNYVGYRELDVFSQASAVPEPASLTLLGLGIAGLAAARRRRAAQA